MVKGRWKGRRETCDGEGKREGEERERHVMVKGRQANYIYLPGYAYCILGRGEEGGGGGGRDVKSQLFPPSHVDTTPSHSFWLEFPIRQLHHHLLNQLIVCTLYTVKKG